MSRICLISILFIGLMAAPVFAAAPAMEWHKGYNTPTGDGPHVHDGMQTSDGGYIGIGQAEVGKDEDMVVIKVDSNGDHLWTTVIGTDRQPDVGYAIAEASDGYICGGGLYDGNQKPGLVKLDKSTGNIQSGWPKYYSGSSNCGIRGIEILGDGSIVACGYTGCGESGFVFIVDEGTGFILKTDSSGNQLWSKTLSTPSAKKVREETGGGFALASNAWYDDGGDHLDAVLIKTDSSGNETNKYRFGGTNGEHCYDFDLTSDGGCILAGHTTSYGVANWDYYLVKVNSSGVEQWYKTFGNPRGYDPQYIHDECYGVRQTPDGGYIMAGGTGDEYSYSASGHSCGTSDEWMAYLVKTDASGNLEWEGLYPCVTGMGNTAAEYIGLTSDGGYIVFNDTDVFWDTLGSEAMGFMKIAGDGAPDTDPPVPDPMTWASVPAADGCGAISMTATTATDPSGVEYYFMETSANPSGDDSGWQDPANYTDSDLTAGLTYTYEVQARDKSANQNATAWSTAKSAVPVGAIDCHVEAMVCSEQSCGGPNKNGVATVTIYDNCGDPIIGADVTGTFTGSFSEQVMDTTDGNGVAVLVTVGCVKKPTFTFCVDDVDHTLPYDPGDNLVTCCND